MSTFSHAQFKVRRLFESQKQIEKGLCCQKMSTFLRHTLNKTHSNLSQNYFCCMGFNFSSGKKSFQLNSIDFPVSLKCLPAKQKGVHSEVHSPLGFKEAHFAFMSSQETAKKGGSFHVRPEVHYTGKTICDDMARRRPLIISLGPPPFSRTDSVRTQ